MNKKKNTIKEVLTILYYISIGAWITTLVITVYTGVSLPMWIALIVMNGLNFARMDWRK